MPIVHGKTSKPVGSAKAEFSIQWKLVYADWKSKSIIAKKAMVLLDLKTNTFYKLEKEYETK